MLFKLCFCTMLLSVISNGPKNDAGKKITVTGIALNAKAGAVVDEGDHLYYLNGVHQWDEKYYGKKVKVTGKLIIDDHKAKSTYPGEFQEIVGKVYIIKKPKWSLVDSLHS